MRSKSSRVVSTLVSLVVFAGLLLSWVNRQDIYDWARLRNYTPPVAIAQLASDTTMNSSAKHIFYVQYPEIEDKSSFNNNCTSGEQTIVLGCYVTIKQRIYLLSVTDKRLAGVEQVTAAHEMLHAAYDRLSKSDKQNVNKLITQAYANVTDARIRTTIADYKKAGADTTNELHSILGTEVKILPKPLEEYYKRYFSNRAKIVVYSEKYQSEFNRRKDAVEVYDKQLAGLKSRIESQQSDLGAKENNLSSLKTTMDSQLASGDTDSYNSNVSKYNNLVSQYNAEVNQIKQLINEYNQILDDRNSIALEEQELYKALDSRSVSTQSSR